MSKRVLQLVLIAIYAGVAGGTPLAPNHSSISENLCLWLRLPGTNYDPTTGVWLDMSEKGNDAAATVDGFVGPTLSSDQSGTVFSRTFHAVYFDPGANDLLKAGNLNSGAGMTDLTIIYVIKLIDTGQGTIGNADQRGVGIGSYNDGSTASNFDLAYDMTIRKDNGSIAGSSATFPRDEFVIHAARMNPDSIHMWFNSTGTLEQVYTAQGSSYTTSTDSLYIGDIRYPGAGEFYIAEMVAYNTALTDEQVDNISQWLQRYVGASAMTAAFGGNPADGATDVSRDTLLSWSPVSTAVERDVYFGTVFDDVNDAGRTNPMGVLLSQGQTATTFDADRLEFDQTYYWRIDEVNGAPDHTLFKGQTWSFTTELLAYPIENVTAISNATSMEGQGPENLVDGSGLDENSQHSNAVNDMWGGTPAADEPTYVQFAFDRVYKLHEMLVWNYNMNFESILGYGVKEATIEYSQNGLDWTVLGDVELAQGTGSLDYTANTTISLDGSAAKYVRMVINSNFSGSSVLYGLSEVRFLHIPIHASEPTPADGTVDLEADSTLSWRPGREAAVHEVYLSTDPNALVMVGTATESHYGPVSLDLDATYFWRIDEVNDAELTSRWAGDVWSFSTKEYLVVEDFEAYNDDIEAGETIWQSWVDGIDDPAGGGSTVGYGQSPFAEQTIVHGGRQAMPFFFNNTNGNTHSEATRTFDTPQNWSAHGIESLTLSLYGASDNVNGQLYVRINGTKVYYESVSDILQRTQWLLWPVDLMASGVNLTNVTSLSIGVDGAGASGVIYVDDIRLYARTAEMIEPILPSDNDPSLAAYYRFDGNVNDSLGAYNLTVVGSPEYEAGTTGQAISFNGINDSAVNAFAQEALWPACSVSFWVKASELAQDINSSIFNNNSSSLDFQIDVDGANPGTYRYRGTIYLYAGPVTPEWVHLATSCDGVETSMYYNGLLTDTGVVADTNFGRIAFGVNRAGDNWFGGVVDEARLYNRALSAGEVAALAGINEPIVGSF